MSGQAEVAVDKITFWVKAWKGKNGQRHVRLFSPGVFAAIDLSESDRLFELLWNRSHDQWQKPARPRKKAQTLSKKKGKHS
jgi:hypothetical protein